MNPREATARAVRGKILGVLLKDARLAAGKSPGECADVIGCPVSIYNTYELGKRHPSLPELELLAYFFNVPLAHFWGNKTLSEEYRDPSQVPAAELNTLRDRIIGAKIRQARLAAKLKLKEFAEELGLTTGQLSAYEFGKKPIPVPELDMIAARLGLTLEDLTERQGPVGEWDSARRDIERFRQLPPELRAFVAQPENESFLRLAQRLSELPADKLRGVAETLLDITY